MADKHAAAHHDGNPLRYECANCEKRWATPSAAEDCCGDWLGYD